MPRGESASRHQESHGRAHVTITPDLEQSARALGLLLALLIAAYPHEWRHGGLLLVVQLWMQETLYHLGRYVRSVQPPSEDWISVRVKATRLAAGRYWRGRLARSARMRGYQRTWIARPEFQAAMKKNVRLAPVRRAEGR